MSKTLEEPTSGVAQPKNVLFNEPGLELKEGVLQRALASTRAEMDGV